MKTIQLTIVPRKKNIHRGTVLVKKTNCNVVGITPKKGKINKSGWCFCDSATFDELKSKEQEVCAFVGAEELKLYDIHAL